MIGGRRHRHVGDRPPRWPNPSRGDLLLLLAVVVVAAGVAVVRYASGTGDVPRAAKTCALSGSVEGWDHIRGIRRAYAEVHVGAILLPAEFDDGERFVELGVADGDGTFRVGCAGVAAPSVIALAHASWGNCLHVTDVVIPPDGAKNLRFEVPDVRMSQLAKVANDLGCTRPPLGFRPR